MKIQNKFYIFFILATCCFVCQSYAVIVNTPETLIVDPGDEISLSGEIYKSVSIHVKPGGIINVHPHGTAGSIGKLNLIAPEILIEGTINAQAVSCNTMGSGGGSPGLGNGAGGGGYGGEGGIGEDAGSPGAGGNIYNDVYYLDDVGSFGGGAGMERSGFGGGCIRLDAISLTIGTATAAYLDAQGNTTAHDGVGGGSGGCILLNGICTLLNSGSILNVSGGHGGSSIGFSGDAGGGGGGRIKFVKHTFNDFGCSLLRNGGNPGSLDAGNGDVGEINEGSAPTPTSPQLLSPEDGQEVGRSPTFTFKATDPADSKFLKYQLIMSLNPLFNPVTFTATQLNPDVGWDKPYYSSGEEASYALQYELEGGRTYYWAVSVTSNEGADWVDSGARSLTATSNNAPCPPQLLQPLQDQIDVSTIPDFKILGADPDGDTLTFKVTLAKDPGLSNPKVFDASYPGWDKSAYVPEETYSGVTATCRILAGDTLDPGTDYYWKAVVSDPYLQTSESEIFHFTTSITPPSTPQLIFPENNYQAPDSRINFRFRAAGVSGNSINGCVQLSRNNFQDIWHSFDQTRDQAGWSETSHQSGRIASFTLPSGIQLERNTTYWWRAYSIEGVVWSAVSETRTFSLADSLEFQNVRIVPNPAVSTSSVRIYIQLSVDAKITIRFYNKLGRELDKIHVQAIGGAQGNIINYDISKYACGIYFYVIEAKSSYGTEKITKQFAVVD